ncbi:hypothetical protein DFA_00653 [Cavenderia fasciculata]|uniref:MYND-type domain-containing protein n=1 Tax=Cavenderia fasciculata TaxID=261658 RepID=F4PSZ9_CACFS|nr:uncharacterized protein DFA_00653 [Cavenderia fasciculata]EGG20788.1 hypothetical protein DFA_00653 [Cavenderia fasciculata]|eukprot:XP_004358638.1 hypothetical protein DFA_00653 [Cavenderia fasciculata]
MKANKPFQNRQSDSIDKPIRNPSTVVIKFEETKLFDDETWSFNFTTIQTPICKYAGMVKYLKRPCFNLIITCATIVKYSRLVVIMSNNDTVPSSSSSTTENTAAAATDVVVGTHQVTMGFTEPVYELRELTSDFFPNKIGGNPVCCRKLVEYYYTILYYTTIISIKRMFININFYAPWSDFEYTYHRTIYLFCCKSAQCNNYKVFRQQLPLDNQVYEIDQEERRYDDDFKVDEKKMSKRQVTCEFCGLHATNKCGKCKQVNYCSRDHQSIDWELHHREHCGKATTLLHRKKHQHHFKQFLIICEDDEFENYDPLTAKQYINEDDEDEDDYDLEEGENEQPKSATGNELVPISSNVQTGEVDTHAPGMEDYQDYLGETGLKDEFSERTFTNMKDRELYQFKLTTKPDQSQVLRYCREDKYRVLWVAEENKPKDLTTDIPKCSNCKSERKFEMQILPQLLHFIEVDSDKLASFNDIDFGVLNIYTCSSSCQFSNESGVIEEFLWRQNFSK